VVAIEGGTDPDRAVVAKTPTLRFSTVGRGCHDIRVMRLRDADLRSVHRVLCESAAAVVARRIEMNARCHVLAVFALVSLAGCPEMTDGLAPRQACESLAASLCERIYACLSPEELAAGNFPPNEAACVTSLEDDQGCRAQTIENACDGNERYHADRAGTCIDQIEGLSCSQLRSANFDIDAAAPACETVCAID
jgi:hypothetical protein